MANTSYQAIKLNQTCLGQAQFNKPGTGHEYESTEPGCAARALGFPSVISSLCGAEPSSSSWFNSFQAAGTNGRIGLSFS